MGSPLTQDDIRPWPLGGGYHGRLFSMGDPSRVDARADFRAEHEAAGKPLFGAEPPPGHAWTLTRGNHRHARPLACGGLEPQGQGRWSVWLYASDLKPMGWAAVRRAMDRAALKLNCRRLELFVRDQAAAGAAMDYAAWLGFEPEGRLRAWSADGADYWLYGKVRR